MTQPYLGKFTRITDVFLPSYIPGAMATTSTHADSPLQVDHQPPVLSTQTLGSVDTVCESSTCTTQNPGSVDRRREAPVPRGPLPPWVWTITGLVVAQVSALRWRPQLDFNK